VLIRAVIGSLGATYRITCVTGEDRLRQLETSRDPVVLSFWHDRVFVMAYFLRRRLMRRGYPVTLLSSLSRDGELGAKLGRLWGAHVVRGSASRGGTAGLRAMYRSIRQRLGAPVVIPDGPQGPQYQAKPGAIVLAQMSGAPIVPLGCDADRFWKLGSWDRLIIPRPFSRVRVVVGTPQIVPKQLSEAELEQQRLLLQRTLDELVGRAETAPNS